MSPRERLERAALRAKRRRLYRALLKQGIEPQKARRLAAAVHAPGAAATRRQTPIDPASGGLWIPPRVRTELRKELTPVDRTALRLKEALRLTSEKAKQIAAESFRRVDVKAGSAPAGVPA